MRPFVAAVLVVLTCACASPTGDGARIVLERADSWMHEGSADAFAELALLRTVTIGRCAAGRAPQRGAELLRAGPPQRFAAR